MTKTGTYQGFKPAWKGGWRYAAPAKTTRPDFTPIRRDYNRSVGPTGPRMAPKGPKTITLSPSEYKWSAPTNPEWDSRFKAAKKLVAEKRLSATLKRLARVGSRLSPYVRSFNLAKDAYDWMTDSELFGWKNYSPGAGWIKVCDRTPYDAPYGIASGEISAGNPIWWGEFNCGLNAQVWKWTGYPPAIGPNTNAIIVGPKLAWTARFQYREIWAKPAGVTYSPVMPGSVSVPATLAPPRLDPAFRPVEMPVPRPSSRTLPQTRLFETVAVQYDGRGGGPTLVKHRLGRPDRKEKEKKRLILAGASALMGAPSEALDLLDAIYGALPKSLRPRGYVAPHDKARLVWKHLDSVDWSDAILNIALNQAQDFLIGKANQMASKPIVSSPYWVRPYGPTAGSQRWGAQITVE